jgi:hypothetical protein
MHRPAPFGSLAGFHRLAGLLPTLAAAACCAMPAAADDRRAVLLSFGPDYGAGSSRAWNEGYLTAEHRSDRDLWRGLRPIYGLAVSREGAALGTVGVFAAFQLGAVEITPHFSLGLWQDGAGGFDEDELIQFRTGIDAFLPLSPDVSVGLGIYHVSNAGITSRSADLDVVRLSLLWRY